VVLASRLLAGGTSGRIAVTSTQTNAMKRPPSATCWRPSRTALPGIGTGRQRSGSSPLGRGISARRGGIWRQRRMTGWRPGNRGPMMLTCSLSMSRSGLLGRSRRRSGCWRAQDRAAAARDRREALDELRAAAAVREAAAKDRMAAAEDRMAAAQDRLAAAEDRMAAEADREQAAVDRELMKPDELG
jgi:hypothetical protein